MYDFKIQYCVSQELLWYCIICLRLSVRPNLKMSPGRMWDLAWYVSISYHPSYRNIPGELHHRGRRRHLDRNFNGLLRCSDHQVHGPGFHPRALGRPWHRLPLLPHCRDLPHVRHPQHHLLWHHHEELRGAEHLGKLEHNSAKCSSHDRQLR